MVLVQSSIMNKLENGVSTTPTSWKFLFFGGNDNQCKSRLFVLYHIIKYKVAHDILNSIEIGYKYGFNFSTLFFILTESKQSVKFKAFSESKKIIFKFKS